MPLYKCELCNFETKIKPHFNRHIGTAKHKKKYLNSQSHENDSIKKTKTNIIKPYIVTLPIKSAAILLFFPPRSSRKPAKRKITIPTTPIAIKRIII